METKRALLFVLGCIGSRLAFVYLAYKYRSYARFMFVLGLLALFPAIGFFVIYALRLRERGIEVGGELIWWNHLRPLHGLLWLSFAITAFLKWPHAWVFLLTDVALGLAAWTNKNIASR